MHISYNFQYNALFLPSTGMVRHVAFLFILEYERQKSLDDSLPRILCVITGSVE